MDKKQIRNWLDDANAKGLISDEKYEEYFRGLNSTSNPSEFWKSIRGEVSGLGGAVNIDKTYKSDVDLADMVAKEIPNIDYEDLTPANKRDIAKNLNISTEDVDRAVETLWHRDLDKAIEENDIEQQNRIISNEYKRAQEVKDSKLAKLGNEYAIRRYIEGASPAEVAVNEVAGKVGTVADFIPVQVPVVGKIAPAIHPTVRAIQKAAYTPADEYDIGSEAWKYGKDLAGSYGAGLIGGKAGLKFLGNTGAGAIGMSGPTAKAAGDVLENIATKYPKATTIAVPGIARTMFGGDNDDEGRKAIKNAENAFEKAVKEAQKRYKDRWDKDQYIPTSEDSEVLQEAYKRYSETRGE